jgi:acyl-CoA thioesterase-1
VAVSRSLRFSILGDSVWRCPGVPTAARLRVQLRDALRARGYDVTLRNHSLEGATSQDGIAYLDWVLRYRPDVVLVSLGANDSFVWGKDNVDAIERNLGVIIDELRRAGVMVLLAGMRVRYDFEWRYKWRMLGKAILNSALSACGLRHRFDANSLQYTRRFNGLYGRVAERHGVPLYPYVLEGVEGDMWQDMYHLNATGARCVVERLVPFLADNFDRLSLPAEAVSASPAKQYQFSS